MCKENHFLYTISGIACILVIFIHVKFPGYVGRLLLPITRFAVPFFFALSGYYCKWICGKSVRMGKGGGKIRKFFILFLKIWFFYLILSLLISFLEGNNFHSWVSEKFTIGNISVLLLFNHSSLLEITWYTSDSLWFLPAMAYVYFVISLFGSFINRYRISILIILGTVLMVGQFISKGKTISLLDETINAAVLVNNWLFDGLFFFLLGNTIKMFTPKLKLPNIDAFVFCEVVAALSLLTIGESFIFHEVDVYFGSILTVIFIFLTAEKLSTHRIPLLSFTGKNLSANIYYWHVFIKALVIVAIGDGFLETGKWILPIVVLLLTFAISYIMYLLEQKRFSLNNLR